MKHIVLLITCLLFTLNAKEIDNPIAKQVYKQGDTLLDFALYSQFGRLKYLNKKTQYLLINFDKVSSKLQNSYFKKVGLSKKILSIIDFSAIPAIPRALFAVPRMKDFDFDLLLSTQKGFCAMFPMKKDHITVMKLENKKIVFIAYIDNERDLRIALHK